MRRFAIHMFVLMLSLLGAACQPSAPSASSNGAERIDITLWHGGFSDALRAAIDTAIVRFHAAHDSIRITTRRYPGHFDEAIRRIQLKIALDERPDLIWLPPVYTADLAASGVLRSVDALAARDSTFHPDLILPRLWDVASHDGTRYTLPVKTNTLALFYDKKAFRQAGVDPPTTWDALTNAAQRLTVDSTGDGSPDRYGLLLPLGTREWTVWTWQTFLWQAGGAFVDRTTMQPAFDSPSGREALRYWVDLLHARGAARLSAPGQGWDLQPLIEGRVAMQINGPWSLPQLDRSDSLDYGVVPLPRHRQRATNIGGENLFILRSDPARERAAWAFARHLVHPETQQALVEKGKSLPVLRSLLETEWFHDRLAEHDAYRVFFDALKHGRTRPAVPQYFSISQIVGEHLQAALRQEMPPDDALHAADEQVRRLLATPDSLSASEPTR
jgi:multiple sugar transport system substrate-binding protein